MKNIFTKTLFLLLFASTTVTVKAQYFCGSFCAKSIQSTVLDTSSKVVNISFYDSVNAFISYPYILGMVNEQGDTVAKGSIEFFGQFSGTTTAYTVQPYNGFINANFKGTIVFLYVDNATFKTDTCILTYPCVKTGINKPHTVSPFTIYPQPANGRFFIQSNQKINVIDIYNLTGEQVGFTTQVNAQGSTEVTLDATSSGIYFVRMQEGNTTYTTKIITY